MSALTIASLVCGVIAVGAYARSERWFAWANATVWPVVALDAATAGAYGSALLAVAFGVVGAWKLWTDRRARLAQRAMLGRYVDIWKDLQITHPLLVALDESGGPIHIQEDK